MLMEVNLKKYITSYLFLFILAGLIIALDQWTKYMIRTQLAFGQIWSPWEWLTPYARIIHWNNTGAAFGIFQGYGGIFTILAIVVSLIIIYIFPRISPQEWALRLALTLQLGGAVGNLIDRLTIGHVTDFISVGNFPVFNVADSSITVGVIVLLISVWIKDAQEKKLGNEKNVSAPPFLPGDSGTNRE